MKKQAVVLSAVVAAFVFVSAQAQDTGTAKKGSDSMLGSEKKTPTGPVNDVSQPESKLGSNAKTKVKTPVGADGKAGPYGTGLKKKDPRSKTPGTNSLPDAPAK